MHRNSLYSRSNHEFFKNAQPCKGEVTELTPNETENPHGGYGKTISSLVIGLKTTKGSKQLKLDPTIYENIQKEKIQVNAVSRKKEG